MKFKSLIRLMLVLLLTGSGTQLMAQSENAIGQWKLEPSGAQKLKMTLVIGTHEGKLFGEFDSPRIGRGSFDNIKLDQSQLTFDLTLGTNFKISGNLKLEGEKEMSGTVMIYGSSVPVKGSLSSRDFDYSPIQSDPAWSPDGQSLAFMSNQYGNKDIVIVDPLGKWRRNLTNHDGADYGAAWSPDGKTLAFISNRNGSNQIYTISAKGKNLKQITTEALAYDMIQWSPDGRKLLFSTPEGPYLMDSDGSGMKNLTNKKQAIYARFSPDGTKVAVTLINQNVYDIGIVDTKTLGLRNLSNSPSPDFNQRWSPDGNRLVWISRRDGNPEVYTMNSDGSEVKRVTNNSHRDNNPSWSVDGRKIIWESRSTATAEIHLANADGSNERNLSNHEANDIDPVWSPNGNWVIFSSERAGNPKLVIIASDGTGMRPLTQKTK